MTILGHRIELGSPTGGAGTGAGQYTANIFVDADDCQDTGHAVLTYLIAQGYEYGTRWQFGNDENNQARLFQISPPQLIASSAYIWRVTLSYKEAKLLTATGSTEVISPVDFLPDIKTRTIGRSKPVEKGVYLGGLGTGWPVEQEREITNSAGTPFIPAVEADYHNKVVRVTRRTTAVIDNETNFPTFWINDRDFTLSNGFITIEFKRFELKFTGWNLDREEYEGYDVVRIEFSGEKKKGLWIEELLDRGVMVDNCGNREDGRGKGYSYNDPTNQAPQRNLLDRAGLPVAVAQNLDGNGNALPKCSTDRFYGGWGIYDAIDPTALGFFAGITSIPTP